MKTIKWISFITLALLFMSCAQSGMKSLESRLTDEGYRKLTAAEITDAFTDNTLNATVSGVTFHIYHKNDGTFVGKRISSSGDERMLSGKWNVSEKADSFCNQFEAQAGSDCDLVYMKDNDFVFVEHDGRESSRGVVEQGNSRGL